MNIKKSVSDIGMGAYILMHGYKVVGRKGGTVYYEIEDTEEEEFDRLCFEYVKNTYHDFDSNLMSLKRLGDYLPKIQEGHVRKSVSDLGISSYLLMHSFEVVGRKGNIFFFDIQEGDSDEFDRLNFEYVKSPFHKFDRNIMSLKKLVDYLPKH